ncbi:hypothetical protein Bbelb_120340 [Branchiostoma belcheri]|nr:hypothetical protein Bbelb_120340 [Branchiostoma belcheri]
MATRKCQTGNMSEDTTRHFSMSNKARRMLVLLLIILKEAGPTAACSSSCSWSRYCYSSCTQCVCVSRGLSSVPQDLPTTITELRLDRNAITTLSQSDFSSNNIHSIEADTFNDTTKLRYLELQYNNISTITAGIFVGLGNLQGLYLDHNQLTNLSADMFEGLGNLRQLYLDNNQLTNLSADTFEGLGNLRQLYLDNNQLTSLSAGIFVGLGNLRQLYLDNNQLTSLPVDIFVGLDNLEELRLHSNNIPSIEAGTFIHTTKLRRLELQHNSISTITADIFGNLLQLQILKLSGNNINTFPVEALSNLNMLSELTLDNNQLETLPVMVYDILASISDVNINNNPWQCDCRMVPFRQRMNGSYPFERWIRCAGPANLIGQYLRNVNPEDLICEETTPVYSTSSTKQFVDSTLSLSSVSSPTPFHQSVSKALTLSPTQSNTLTSTTLSPTQSTTPTADSNPGWSTVSSSSPFNPSTKSTSKVPTLSPSQSNTLTPTMTENKTGPSDGGIVLSVPLLATLGVILGVSIICIIGFAVGCMYMYKRRQRDPTPQQGFSNTNPRGTSSGHDQIGLQAITTNAAGKDADIDVHMLHPDTEDSQHIYNLPTDEDPDTAEYNTIGEVNQSETHIDSLSLSSQPGSGQIQHLGNFNDGYKVPSPSLYPGEGPQSHKYMNSHVTAAAKDAAAGPQVIVYENIDELVDNQSQTAAAPGADSPHPYEPLRNPSSQQQHTYTSLMPHGSQHN